MLRNSLPDLAERLRNGENAAFDYLYRACYKDVEAYILANSGSEQEARDLFQEALLVLFKKMQDETFRLNTQAEVYLSVVAQKMWLYRLRSKKAHPVQALDEQAHAQTVEADDDLELLLQEQENSEKIDRVKVGLEKLKPDQRLFLEYVYFFKYPTAEIARLMGYSEDFVKVKKHRCLAALRKLM